MPRMGAKWRKSRSSQPHFTRAGGQDDVSLDKLPQIIHIGLIIINTVSIGIITSRPLYGGGSGVCIYSDDVYIAFVICCSPLGVFGTHRPGAGARAHRGTKLGGDTSKYFKKT